MGKSQISLEVVNPNAAGINISSRSHRAAGQNAKDAKEFSVYCQNQLKIYHLSYSNIKIISFYHTPDES